MHAIHRWFGIVTGIILGLLMPYAAISGPLLSPIDLSVLSVDAPHRVPELSELRGSVRSFDPSSGRMVVDATDPYTLSGRLILDVHIDERTAFFPESARVTILAGTTIKIRIEKGPGALRAATVIKAEI